MELHRKPHRLQRRDVGHQAHFYTFSCFRRQTFLERPRCRQWLIDALGRAIELHDLSLWAWVIMPEHVHVIVQPRQVPYAGGRVLKSIKQPVAQLAVGYVRAHAPAFLPRMLDAQPNGRRTHRFWQRGAGYDRNLFSVREIWEKIKYIHENPMTRGLVAKPTDYYWSSAQNFAGMRHGPLPFDFASIPK